MTFASPSASHEHSLEILNQLYEYDDFMLSIRSVLDLGCGSGNDLLWWANRTTRDDAPMPLNIDCTGVDVNADQFRQSGPANLRYITQDFEQDIEPYKGGYDILWCHDAFQYATAPLSTLSQWRDLASPSGMLCITVPVTQQVHRKQLDFWLDNGAFYHHTLVSLIYMLAASGWDCKSGFFKQYPTDDYISAIVYKSSHQPKRSASWTQLAELELLPKTAEDSILRHGYLKQQDLVLPWVDHSLHSMEIK